ncbi:MAG: NADH dehydrogenase (quinone) subunit D [Armatimonadota bacterium]|nr:NADH dehydrogenase (quinone) subunit D [Armatimonadota bacterium]
MTVTDELITSESFDRLLAEAKALSRREEGREITLKCEPAEIVRLAGVFRDDPELRFSFLSDIVYVDHYGQPGNGARFELIYRAYNLDDYRRIHIRVPVPDGQSVDSVAGIWPAANWYEREAFDLMGFRFANHPDPRRILLPSAFAGHPLRKDFPIGGEEVQFSVNWGEIEPQETMLDQCFEGMTWKEYVERGDDIETEAGASPLRKWAEEDRMIINMGPQHPSTHGVLRLALALEGETVLDAACDIGFLHTGIEKSAEQLMFQQALTLTDRMDYAGPLGDNLAYVLSVEKLLGIEVPPRAQALRVMLAELTRIASHLLFLGTHALELGAVSVFLYCFQDREQILDIFELASGVRLMTSYINIGGLRDDIPEGFSAKVREFLEYLPPKLVEYHALLTRNPIWLERTRGVGVISVEDGIRMGVSGANIRGSGLKWDVRKAWPYSGYENYDFEIPTGSNGDVYDRYLVRMEEMRQSLRIVRQALDNLPGGDYRISDYKIVLPPRDRLAVSMEAVIHHFLVASRGFDVPAGDAYVSTESARGEMGFHVVSHGGPKPWRMKMRPPSFATLQALPKMVTGGMLADVVATVGSIDIILGEVDR